MNHKSTPELSPFPVGERVLTLNYADRQNPTVQYGVVTGPTKYNNEREVLIDGETVASGIPMNNLLKVFLFAKDAK